uniref:Ribosomal protein S1 n=1 Tax=Spyridia filamentosa TaxID=196632 RepID=A0A1Z1MKD5_SPYFI|nr:ribosomal protein S1 [Spyridia filamentosa]ARW66302.1 ribosomal protein S1 [Spyridia filamentosa]
MSHYSCNKGKKFIEILRKYDYQLNKGDIVAGTILYQENQGFLVNIGDKITGYLPYEEIYINRNQVKSSFNSILNTTREFFVLACNLKKQQTIVSIKRLEYIRGWKRLRQIKDNQIIFNLPIVNVNKGGIIICIEGIQGFIPNSHISNRLNYVNSNQKYIQGKILTANEKSNQIIISNKSALLSLSKHKFKIGELMYGKIIKIKHYGLFIEIFNIIGLLHVSEVSFNHIKNLHKMFQVNKFIKIKILYVNNKQGKLYVSRKQFDE